MKKHRNNIVVNNIVSVKSDIENVALRYQNNCWILFLKVKEGGFETTFIDVAHSKKGNYVKVIANINDVLYECWAEVAFINSLLIKHANGMWVAKSIDGSDYFIGNLHDPSLDLSEYCHYKYEGAETFAFYDSEPALKVECGKIIYSGKSDYVFSLADGSWWYVCPMFNELIGPFKSLGDAKSAMLVAAFAPDVCPNCGETTFRAEWPHVICNSCSHKMKIE